MDADVVVLGAGFAGITAARDLHAAGHRVRVLEARDRIGGRTWYREIPGTGAWAEYGGMFFSRETQPHLATAIERYGIAVSPSIEPAQVAWVRGSERRQGTEALDAVRDKLASSGLAEYLRTTAAGFGGAGRVSLAAQDIATSAWIDSLDADDEGADYLRSFMAAMGGTRIERSSVLPLLWDMVELGYSPVDAYVDMASCSSTGRRAWSTRWPRASTWRSARW